MKSIESLKRKLWTWYQARSAAGEKSLLSWGREQRPPLTSGQVEQLADSLVEDGVLTKERRGSGWVWLRVHDAELPEPEPELPTPTPAAPAESPSFTPPPPDQEAPKEPAVSLIRPDSEPPPAAPTSPPQPPPARAAKAQVHVALPVMMSDAEARVELLLDMDEEQLIAAIAARRRLDKACSALEAAQLEKDAALADLERIARGEKLPEAPAAAALPASSTSGDSTRARILAIFRDSPSGTEIEASKLTAQLGLERNSTSGPLSNLTAEGLLERPRRGVYVLTSKGRMYDR